MTYRAHQWQFDQCLECNVYLIAGSLKDHCNQIHRISGTGTTLPLSPQQRHRGTRYHSCGRRLKFTDLCRGIRVGWLTTLTYGYMYPTSMCGTRWSYWRKITKLISFIPSLTCFSLGRSSLGGTPPRRCMCVQVLERKHEFLAAEDTWSKAELELWQAYVHPFSMI